MILQVKGLGNIRVNPMRITSSVLLILAPFLSWITVSAFGITAQSNLIDVSQSRTPLPIPPNLPVVSLFSIVLLIIGGLIILRKAIIGLPIATTGLGIYSFEAYSLYGSQVSAIPLVVAPGIGLLIALVAVGTGAVSLRIKSQDFSSLLNGLRTRDGLMGLGLFVASVALLLDGMNHAFQGEASAFFGTGIIEPLFHNGFFVSIFLLVFLFAARKWYQNPAMGSVLVLAAFAFIGLDAAYHLSSGDAAGFLGHDFQETILHTLAYYGTALVVIGRLSPPGKLKNPAK
jgi:hypothetical protein